MEKNMMVLEIMNLYDENEKLRNTVEWLSRTESSLENNLIKYAKQHLFNAVVWNYNNIIECNPFDDECTPYEEWLEIVIQRRCIPDWMSYEQFIDMFNNEIYEKYSADCTEVLRKRVQEHGIGKEDK